MFWFPEKIIYFISILVFILLLEMSTPIMKSAMLPNLRHGFHTPRPRVVDGLPDLKNRYPFVVSLQMDTKLPVPIRLCTGSLIKSQWVLTVAHCVQNETNIGIVVCGDMSVPINETKCKSKILKKFYQPNYAAATFYITNDIGLLFIEKMEMERYGRLHGADYATFAGRSVRYAGFGLTHRFTTKINVKQIIEDFTKPLQVGKGVVYNGNEDGIGFGPRILIGPTCAKKEQFSHQGDSGGPAFIDGMIVGVCSGGTDPNLNTNVKSAYTPVSPYLNWIRKIISEA